MIELIKGDHSGDQKASMPNATTIRRHSIKAQRRFIKYSFLIVVCMNIILWGVLLVKFIRNFKKLV